MHPNKHNNNTHTWRDISMFMCLSCDTEVASRVSQMVCTHQIKTHIPHALRALRTDHADAACKILARLVPITNM